MSKVRNELLRQERVKRGWSQARVAEQIDTDAVNISRWERGYAMPSPYYREKLCLLFEKSAQELGFIQEEPVEEVAPVEEARQLTSANQASTIAMLSQDTIQYPQTQQKLNIPSSSARFLAALAYLLGWLSGLFFFLLARERFVRFHSLQATLFFGVSNLLLLGIIVVLGTHDPTISGKVPGLIFAILFALINLFTFVVWLVGMIQALQGRYYHLPLVGHVSQRFLTGEQIGLDTSTGS